MSKRAEGSDTDFWGDVDESEALQRYQTLVNTVDDGIYQLDTDGCFAAVNDIIVETTGYSRNELVGEHVSMLLDSDAIERITREISERLADGRNEIGAFEVTIETADGDQLPVALRISPLLEDGEFHGTVGVARDISDRRRRQERVETAMESYETIASVLDEADVGVFILDESFDVAWIDATVEEYFDLDREAVIGRDKRDLVEETIRHRVADGDAFADTVFATYENNSYEERFDCRVTPGPNREERWLEHRSRPIESGRYAGGRVELYYDVTEQRRRAAQLRRLNEAVNEWLEESSREVVAERASDHFRDILDMEINGVFLYDSETDALRPASWTETTEAVFGDLPTFEAGEGIAWRVFESGEAAFYDDVRDAPDVYDSDTPIRSEMVLPIGDHGVAIVGSEERNAFDDGDLMLAKVATSSLESTFNRLRHERRLERERDLTERVLDAVPVGAIVLDSDGEITRINDRAQEIFAVGDPETYAPSDRPTYDENGNRLKVDEHPFATVLETGEPVYDRILQVELPDGDRRWLSVNAVPITDADGEIDRVVTTGEDITDLKERERELETELSEVFGRVSDGFYAVDEKYRFTHLNERAEELLGVTEDELRGRRLGEVYPETPEVARIRDRFDEAMATQEPISLDYYSELLGFWVEATIYPSESGVSVYFRDVTERKERERQLRERERRLERYKEYTDDVLDAIDDVFYILDEDGELIRWNETLGAVTGYDDDEIAEMHATEFFEGDNRAAAAAALREGLETGSVSVEVELSTKAGDRIPYEFDASRLEDPQGNTVLAGIGRDVTERKEHERELEQYQTLTKAARDVIVTIDADSTIKTVNPAVREVFGYEPSEVIDESLTKLMPADLTDQHRAALGRYLETNERTVNWEYLELPGVTADGEEIPLGISFDEAVYDGERYFTGVVRDITERKEREQALQESRNQLQALIDVLPVAVFVAEADGEIVEWNEAAEEIWGGEIAESESVAEYDRYEAWWADTGEPVEPDEWPLARALDGEEVTDPDEIRIKGFDGEYRTVLNHGMPVRDADGEVSRAVVTLVDITERKEYQRKLEESNERLEQFAYAASHDLQEPLRMVSSYLQLIERRYADELDDDGEEFIQFAVDGADRMRAMIEGLLEYSRVETEGDPLEPVDLETVLDDVLEDLQFQIEEFNTEITADELPRVEGDASQLRQVFQNLLDNAIEYSGNEPPRIHVSAERDGSEWRISVHDDGIGIDPDDQDRIFEVFQRLHNREEHTGTGIGLALCERIVERHGGDIWVNSEPGDGSTFSFTLPDS